MPKVKSLSRSRRSSATLIDFSRDGDGCTITHQHNQQQEQHSDVRLPSCVSSSSSSLLDHHPERRQLPQQDSFPALKNQRKVSIDHILTSTPPSPIRHEDVTSIFLNSEYAAQDHPHYKRRKPRSKLARSGCLSSLLDQVSSIDEHSSTVNSISEDDISITMNGNGNCTDHHCIINSSQSLTHNMVPTTTATECNDQSNVGDGWGQFIDVIPIEPSTRRRHLDSPGGTSLFGMRYSPYSTVSRVRSRTHRCLASDLVNLVNDVGTKMRHSPSTDCISSALYRVQISGMKQT